MNNKIFFDERIGPGEFINHGEDTIFLKEFLKKTAIFSSGMVAFSVSNKESGWLGKNRNIQHEIIAQGFVYSIIYPYSPRIMLLAHFLSHRRHYKGVNIISFLKLAFSGIKMERLNKDVC